MRRRFDVAEQQYESLTKLGTSKLLTAVGRVRRDLPAFQ
jgi:hypothetical protein